MLHSTQPIKFFHAIWPLTYDKDHTEKNHTVFADQVIISIMLVSVRLQPTPLPL